MALARPATRSSLDAKPETKSTAASRGIRPLESGRRRRVSLLWWLFLANGAVLVVTFLLLALTPITISSPVTVGELALLMAGLAAMLALNLVLLRRVLSPLLKLTELMSSIDPDRPGRRLPGVHLFSAEGTALAEAFNGMLDRLETARREAARTALAAQEAERLRVARELHDEIGQTLTAVTIQAERAADGDSALASRELRRVADAVRESLDEVRRIATGAATGGARRPRPGQRADRAVLADRRPRRSPGEARAPGQSPAARARSGTGHLPRRAGKPYQHPPAR